MNLEKENKKNHLALFLTVKVHVAGLSREGWRLFLAVPRGCLQFVIVVFPDHAHLLFSKCITPSIADQKSKAPVTQSQFRPRFTTTRPDLNQMVKSGCVRMEKKKIEHQYSVSITMLQRCLSAQLIYRSSMSHDGSAMIHHGGATNAQDAGISLRFGVAGRHCQGTGQFSLLCSILLWTNLSK